MKETSGDDAQTVEVERRFFVRFLPELGQGRAIEQGYVALDDGVCVRVRRSGSQAWLTVKGPTQGASRTEVEVPVSLVQAQALFTLCGARRIVKERFCVHVGAHTFEVDRFHGRHEGLVIAEVELSTEDEDFDRPDWLGEEITQDARYHNAALALGSGWPCT